MGYAHDGGVFIEIGVCCTCDHCGGSVHVGVCSL